MTDKSLSVKNYYHLKRSTIEAVIVKITVYHFTDHSESESEIRGTSKSVIMAGNHGMNAGYSVKSFNRL